MDDFAVLWSNFIQATLLLIFHRLPDSKCRPKQPPSDSSPRQRSGEVNPRSGSLVGHPNATQSHSSKHRSRDVASSITHVQEPEKAYYDPTIKTQPQPIEQMTMVLPQMVLRSTEPESSSGVQSDTSTPKIPGYILPSDSSFTSSTFDRRQSKGDPHMTQYEHGAMFAPTRGVQVTSAQTAPPPS